MARNVSRHTVVRPLSGCCSRLIPESRYRRRSRIGRMSLPLGGRVRIVDTRLSVWVVVSGDVLRVRAVAVLFGEACFEVWVKAEGGWLCRFRLAGCGLLDYLTHSLDVRLGLFGCGEHGEGSRRALLGRCRCDRTGATNNPHLSSGARLPRWGAAQKNYLDLLYWVTRCHPWGDTVSGLSRLGLFADEDFPHGRHVPARSGRGVDDSRLTSAGLCR